MWLIEQRAKQEIERAMASGYEPSAAARSEFEAAADFAKVGKIAEIQIQGVLTKNKDFFAMLFGGGNTTYTAIIDALKSAQADPEIEEIRLIIDSPGGSVNGLFDTIDQLRAMTKPVKAIVEGMAASAAYALASQAEEIIATNKAAFIGSIGIVTSMYHDESRIEITSTAAPKKRPDPTTDEGVAVIREELDALHELFAEAIAMGRGTTIEEVNEKYGQGATLLANEAVKRGMIDGIRESARPVKRPKTKSAQGGEIQKGAVMDIKTLQHEHPAVFDAALQMGVKQERDRVTAHLVMGEGCGAVDIACEAIKSGDDMTQTLQAKYMTAGRNKSDIDARQSDDDSASVADGQPERTESTESDAVVSAVLANLGVEA